MLEASVPIYRDLDHRNQSHEAQAVSQIFPSVPDHVPTVACSISPSAPSVEIATDIPEVMSDRPQSSIIQETKSPAVPAGCKADYSALYAPTDAYAPPVYPSLSGFDASCDSAYPSLNEVSKAPTYTCSSSPAANFDPVVMAAPPSYEDYVISVVEAHDATSAESHSAATYDAPAPVVSEVSVHNSSHEISAGERIDVSPDIQMQMVETPESAEQGALKFVQCVSCSQWLQVLKEAQMVYCPTCTTVSSCDAGESAEEPPPAPPRKLEKTPWYSCINKVFS